MVSVIGSWMQFTAQAWLVYRLTRSELLLGLVGFADKVPVFLFGLAGGLVADRFDRHRVVIATQTASMIQALVLGGLVVSGRARIWHIFVLVTAQGIINAFDLPARQSFHAAMVAPEDLPNALALNSSIFNAARVIGPAVAGVLVALIGEGPCFLINGFSFMAVLAGLLMMKFDRPRAGGGDPAPLDSLVQGILFVWRNPPVRALMILVGLVSLCGMPYLVFMPVFAGEILGGGPRGLGILTGCAGMGAFVSAVTLARRKSVRGLGRVVAAGSVAFGLTLILFSLSRVFALSAAILVVVGFAMIAMAAATNLLLQALVPDSLRGRVMSLYTVMFVGMAPFGSLAAGAMAHRLGTPATVAIGGALSAAAGGIFANRIPQLRRFVRYPIPESAVSPAPESV
jgi:MFS family permease